MPLLALLLMPGTATSAMLDDDGDDDEEPRTRSARWRVLRLERTRSIEPASSAGLERAFLRFEEALSEPVPAKTMEPIEESLQLVNEGLGDLPFPGYRDRAIHAGGSIRSGGGFSFGLRLVEPNVVSRDTGVGLDATAALSLNHYQFCRVRFGKLLPIMARTALLGPMLEARDDPWFAYLDARYEDFREETLFVPAPGASDPEPDDRDFRHRIAVLNGIVGYRFGLATASARVGYAGNRVSSGSESGERGDALTLDSDSDSDSDRAPSADFLELAASLQLDTDFARIDEIVAVVVADQERSDPVPGRKAF